MELYTENLKWNYNSDPMGLKELIKIIIDHHRAIQRSKSKMGAKEYLENKYGEHSLATAKDMESYHLEKSKEEAEERYEEALKLIPKHLGTLDRHEVVIAVLLAAFGKEES